MRVVSLVPAATDWVAAFGGADDLVGEPSGAFDPEHLRAIQPDLVIGTAADAAVLAGESGEAFVFEPRTFKEALDAALRLGRRIGRLPEAMRVLGEGERRLRALHARIGLDRPSRGGAARPRVACVERADPLTLAGRWVPDLVEMAGGRAVGPASGEPARPVDWGDLAAADPDVIVGFGDLQPLAGRAGWEQLRAVRDGRVCVVGAAFERPGPGLYRAVEVLAAALFAGRAGVELGAGELRRIGELGYEGGQPR